MRVQSWLFHVHSYPLVDTLETRGWFVGFLTRVRCERHYVSLAGVEDTGWNDRSSDPLPYLCLEGYRASLSV